MSWFNAYGLVFVAVIMIPNIVFALTNPDGFQNKYRNRAVERIEQVGRFGCFGFMFLSIPGLCKGFWFEGAKTAYLASGSVLVLFYCIGWIVFWRENTLRKALTLSILPSVLFLESGILTCNGPLLVCAMLFACCHITISYKNAVL